jgi:5-(carboxyamino)imidazole ribonucleotide mutase
MSSQPNADADAAQVPDVPGVVVLCGSERDMAHAREIAEAAREFGLGAVIRIASAHRTPEKALQIIRDLNTAARRVPVVLITVAGRSNALSGFCDPQTVLPVIACPPPSDFADDVWSSLRMPTGVAPLYVCNPTNAAVAAAKIIGLSNPALHARHAPPTPHPSLPAPQACPPPQWRRRSPSISRLHVKHSKKRTLARARMHALRMAANQSGNAPRNELCKCAAEACWGEVAGVAALLIVVQCMHRCRMRVWRAIVQAWSAVKGAFTEHFTERALVFCV